MGSASVIDTKWKLIYFSRFFTESLLYGLCEEAFRCLKECDERYGGMLVMLSGDPFQLAVVGCRKGLADVHKATERVSALLGRRLYQEIKNVVYLTENMRFESDPVWGHLLSLARRGEWTDEMKAILLARLQANIRDDCTDFRNKYTQVISSDNAMRHTINLQILKCVAATTTVFKVPARIGPKASLQPDVFRLNDNKTQSLPVIGYYYPGMQVRMKANQCLEKGVANGTCGRIHHIEWPENTNFSTFDEDNFCCPDKEPMNIFVDVLNAPPATKAIPFPGLCEHWPPTVMPIYREKKTFKWNNHAMNISQFPIVPAFATTCYGAQGSTYETACVAGLRPPHYRNPDPHSLYVALSRVRSSKNLIMMEATPDEDFSFFRPSPATIAEDDRLLALHASTIDSFRIQIQAI